MSRILCRFCHDHDSATHTGSRPLRERVDLTFAGDRDDNAWVGEDPGPSERHLALGGDSLGDDG
jgi:hypothetical protein